MTRMVWRTMLAWDRRLTARLTLPSDTKSGRFWRGLAHGIAHSGDGALWVIGAVLAYAWGQGNWSEGGRRVLLGTVFGGVTVWLLKQVFRRRRPVPESQGLYLKLDVHSFPSGHAGRNACVVFYLIPLFSSPLQAGMLAWLAVMGLSRVALGIHYFSDVLVGFLVGSTIGWALR